MEQHLLTGRDATEALKLYTRLADVGARFDARRVAFAMRSERGRLRVAAALVSSLRAFVAAVRGGVLPPPQRTRENGSRRLRRAPTAVGSPGRPRRPGWGA